jgi:hypothetical protein
VLLITIWEKIGRRGFEIVTGLGAFVNGRRGEILASSTWFRSLHDLGGEILEQ